MFVVIVYDNSFQLNGIYLYTIFYVNKLKITKRKGYITYRFETWKINGNIEPCWFLNGRKSKHYCTTDKYKIIDTVSSNLVIVALNTDSWGGR